MMKRKFCLFELVLYIHGQQLRSFEPRHEKTGFFLPMEKQRRSSAVQ